MSGQHPVPPTRPGLASRLLGIGDEGARGLAAQLDLHGRLGWERIELRTVDGARMHEIDDDTHRANAELVTTRGMTVPVVDTPIGSWAVDVSVDLGTEVALLRRYAAVAGIYGSTALRVMSYPNDGWPVPEWRAEALHRMAVLAAVAADLGVELLHENCDGWASTGPRETLELLDAVGTDHLGLLFDSGNGVTHGYDSLEFLLPVIDHVRHVHLKDSVRLEGDGDVAFVELGAGASRVVDCVRALEAAGYAGLYSIEPHVHLVPHAGRRGDPVHMRDAYLAYGRHATTLLTELDAPGSPDDLPG